VTRKLPRGWHDLKISIPAGLLIFFITLPAQAAETTFNFTGVIVQVDGPLLSTFAIGDVITGSYTFDPSTPDRVPNDPHRWYLFIQSCVFSIRWQVHFVGDRI
jgi:hypothetical protein